MAPVRRPRDTQNTTHSKTRDAIVGFAGDSYIAAITASSPDELRRLATSEQITR